MEQNNINNMNFEEAMSELEAIVRRLEEGKSSLEDAIKYYERGSVLRKHCEKKLQDAKLRIEKISVNSNGEIQTEPMSFSG